MDIWNWVEKLQGDLCQVGQVQNVYLLNCFVDEVSELQIDCVDVLLFEVCVLGKVLDNFWVDVYVGYWVLCNCVGNCVEGESVFGEVVVLFECVYCEDMLECLQLICVIQDLVVCYGNIDGLGWVFECIEVCDEIFGCIDLSWVCFQCLSCEKVDVLFDDGCGQEVLDYLQVQVDVVEVCGKEVFDSFFEMQIKILFVVGCVDEVLVLIEKCEVEVVVFGEYEFVNCMVLCCLFKVWVLVQLGCDEEVLQQLVLWSELILNYWWLWVNIVVVLCQCDFV